MSISLIIQLLEKLLLLQKSLSKLAVHKTDIIKAGDVQALSSLMKEEQNHLQAIKQIESSLISQVKKVIQPSVSSQLTLTNLVDMVNGPEKQVMKGLQSELEEQMLILKNQNELNQELLHQSLQFINLSLDLLLPEIDSYNYESSDGVDTKPQSNRSLFDSKA
ncbi:flagellar protein FlgN [Cytobacillus sp. FJAT-54145]|uniref:Flagellar protein FlgN n=1 Tax=Cytobacillus spartinae TaxID=3299023 RepID=A0ABW6KBP9_9BACI